MRDGNKCQYPGCTQVDKLEIHHIRRFAQNKHLRTATYNGITLCSACHDKISQKEEFFELMFFKIVQANEKAYKKYVEGVKEASKNLKNASDTNKDNS